MTRARDVLAEAWATVRAQRVPSATIALLAAAMCLITLLTVGRTAHAEAQVADRLESAGSRVLQVADIKDADLITPAVADTTAALSTVERSIATTLPADVVPSPATGGQRVPMWQAHGDLAQVATLTAGRWPAPGEAIVSAGTAAAYGLDGPVGAVATTTGWELPVVGIFTAREPFTDYDAGVLVTAGPDAGLRSLTVVATTAEVAGTTQGQVLQLIAASSPQDLRVTSPATLAEVQQAVGADLTTFSRSLLALVLSAGGVLMAIVVLADVLVRQRDLGRRRALGADRPTIITLVVARTLIAATLGALVGTTAAVAITTSSGVRAPAGFIAAVAVLALLTAAIAAIPPAAIAAYRDPVAVLRTP